MRVVSLLPAATELVYALGVEPVGVSHECDYPPAARERPTVVRSRVDSDGSSGAIDEEVQDAVDSGGVYEIDREQLAALDPDVIVSQGMCDVCAVDDSFVREAVMDLGLDVEFVTTDPHSLQDVFEDLLGLGEVLGKEDRAREVHTTLETRVEVVAQATPEGGTRVAVLDWLDPVMVAGHWVPELVETGGCAYGLADPGDRSTPREWATIREYDPDILVVSPCGFELPQIAANRTDLTDRPGWSSLRAVRNGQVYAIDGHHYMNRPGPRLVETLEVLAGCLHHEPDRFVDDEEVGERVQPWAELTADEIAESR